MRTRILDIIERVATTYLEAFVAVLILAGTINLSTAQAAALAGVVAVLNLAYRALTALKPHTGTPIGDLLERIVVTFAATAIGALLTAQHFGITDLRAAAIGGLAAALAVGKAGIAGLLTSTPSLAAPLTPIGSTKSTGTASIDLDVEKFASAIVQALKQQQPPAEPQTAVDETQPQVT